MDRNSARALFRNLGFLGAALMTVIAMLTSVSGGQTEQVRITVSAPSTIQVEVTSEGIDQSWSFRNSYGSVLGLASRLKGFQATSQDGHKIEVTKVGPGEFRAAEPASHFAYTVNLPAPEPGTMSHVSWLTNEYGLLMFADLLPLNLGKGNGKIRAVAAEFELPRGWTIGSAIAPDHNRYPLGEPDSAVFIVGTSLRHSEKTVDGMPFELISQGVWPFPSSKAMAAAASVLRKYSALTNFHLRGKSVVLLAPFPVSSAGSEWKAETRGSTVVLLISPTAHFTTWIGQLAVIFTHELLHLWVPNSLRLEGDYDWFFEGFTLYVGLRTALELKLINFREYLDTLARTYDSYLSYASDQSLVEASERRWTSSNQLVYDKGMLVAFLYDLVVRQESMGKTTLGDYYPPLFTHYTDKPANANEVIMNILSTTPGTRDFPKNYVANKGRLDLGPLLTKFGFVMDSSGPRSRLMIRPDLTRDQRHLLKSLGYRR